MFEHRTNLSSGSPAGSTAGSTLVLAAPAGESALWLCSVKKIEVSAGGFVFLG